jgi:hypothetical protein
MNTLNRFSNLDEDYYECDDNVNSFKPMKKTTKFKPTETVQDTTPEFKLTNDLFPSLTKTVKPATVPSSVSLSFSKIINTKETIEVLLVEEEEPNTMREDCCYVAFFNKKTRVLDMPKVVATKVLTEEDVQVELFKDANHVLQKLNELHIRRSKEYLFTWGEDEFIRTFLSERDVESAPIFFKTS